MPVITIVVPELPAGSKDLFLTSWPTIAESFKGHPNVKGISGGQIVAADGSAVTDFRFLQLLAFDTVEDEAAFFSSDLIKTLEATKEDSTTVHRSTFQTSEFPVGTSPKKYTQFSSITNIDITKEDEQRAAWTELTTALGQEKWGGVSIGDGPTVGLGLLGWDSLEDAGASFQKPEVAAAFQKWTSLGEAKNVVVELIRY